MGDPVQPEQVTGRNAAQWGIHPIRDPSTGWYKVPPAVPLSPAVPASTRVSARKKPPPGRRFIRECRGGVNRCHAGYLVHGSPYEGEAHKDWLRVSYEGRTSATLFSEPALNRFGILRSGTTQVGVHNTNIYRALNSTELHNIIIKHS